MKKLVSGIMLFSMIVLGGSLVGAEASIPQDGLKVSTGQGNPTPNGTGFISSGNALEGKQTFTITVNDTDVAKGDPPSPM